MKNLSPTDDTDSGDASTDGSTGGVPSFWMNQDKIGVFLVGVAAANKIESMTTVQAKWMVVMFDVTNIGR